MKTALFIVVGVLVILIGAYAMRSLNTTQAPQSSQNQTGWLTYKSQAGFEFQYPPDWKITDERPDLVQIKGSGGFNVEYRNIANQNLQEAAKNILRSDTASSTTVAGIPALERDFYLQTQEVIDIVAQRPGDSRILWIDMEPARDESGNTLQGSVSTLKEILATFNFAQ